MARSVVVCPIQPTNLRCPHIGLTYAHSHQLRIKDVGSLHGTFLNGVKLIPQVSKRVNNDSLSVPLRPSLSFPVLTSVVPPSITFGKSVAKRDSVGGKHCDASGTLESAY
jgi:hypothetical protein